MKRLGISRGDVCVVFTPNHIYVPIAYLGFIAYGAAFSGLNPSYTVQEMVYQIKTIEAKMILVHPALIKTVTAAAYRAGISKDRLFLFSDKFHEPLEGVKDWQTMIGAEADGETWTWKSLSPKESLSTIATVNFSSGTTGLPKGVCVSHHNIIANVEQIKEAANFAPVERWIGFLPFYHAYGQVTILLAIKLNHPVVVMSAFNFEQYLQIVQDHKISRLQLVPPILILLTKRPEVSTYDLTSVQKITCGGAPLSSELQKAAEQTFRGRAKISQGWGMTEITSGAVMTPSIKTPFSSTGKLMRNTEVKLIDDDGKEVTEPNTAGEIYVRGPQIALGYWRNDVATKEIFIEGGWLKTGDVAIVDEKSFVFIVDRKKELIKVNGLQVSPAELEGVLLENNDIADAAVVGITIHEEEWPRAYVVLNPEKVGKVSEGQIQEWIKPRVAKHKALRGGVSLVSEIPKLASGKIVRKVVREWSKRDAKELERRGELKAKL